MICRSGHVTGFEPFPDGCFNSSSVFNNVCVRQRRFTTLSVTSTFSLKIRVNVQSGKSEGRGCFGIFGLQRLLLKKLAQILYMG